MAGAHPDRLTATVQGGAVGRFTDAAGKSFSYRARPATGREGLFRADGKLTARRGPAKRLYISFPPAGEQRRRSGCRGLPAELFRAFKPEGESPSPLGNVSPGPGSWCPRGVPPAPDQSAPSPA